MKRMMRALSLTALLTAMTMGVPSDDRAQAQTVRLPGNFAPGSSMGFGAADDAWTPVTEATPLPTAPKREAYTLVSANAPAAPATVYGGQYVVTQGCAAYGTVTVRYRGPDGATMLPLLSRGASDSNGGTIVALGSAAMIDATVSGTTGCNVQIARLP